VNIHDIGSRINRMSPKKKRGWWAASISAVVLTLFFCSQGGRFTVKSTGSGSPVPVLFSAQRALLSVRLAESEDLNPRQGDDFLLFLWVRLARQPSKKARSIVVLKYDADSPERQGYGVALAQGQGGVRPEVYWKGEAREGGWYPFPEIELELRRWYLLAVSFRSGRLLGLHVVADSPAGAMRLQTLGGHKVPDLLPPRARSPIVVGRSLGRSSFRGDVGPVGIIVGSHLSEHLESIIDAVTHEPTRAPPLPSSLHLIGWNITKMTSDGDAGGHR
jgi:hypothetical protein